MVIGYLRIAYEFGIELITTSMILIGIIYGPSFAFLFGLLIYPVIDAFRWMVAVPFEAEWPPLIPSPDSLIAGVLGFIAGFLIDFLPFFVVVFACLIARIPMAVAKDMLFTGMPFKPGYLFGIAFTFFVIYLLQFLVT